MSHWVAFAEGAGGDGEYEVFKLLGLVFECCVAGVAGAVGESQLAQCSGVDEHRGVTGECHGQWGGIGTGRGESGGPDRVVWGVKQLLSAGGVVVCAHLVGSGEVVDECFGDLVQAGEAFRVGDPAVGLLRWGVLLPQLAVGNVPALRGPEYLLR